MPCVIKLSIVEPNPGRFPDIGVSLNSASLIGISWCSSLSEMDFCSIFLFSTSACTGKLSLERGSGSNSFLKSNITDNFSCLIFSFCTVSSVQIVSTGAFSSRVVSFGDSSSILTSLVIVSLDGPCTCTFSSSDLPNVSITSAEVSTVSDEVPRSTSSKGVSANIAFWISAFETGSTITASSSSWLSLETTEK